MIPRTSALAPLLLFAAAGCSSGAHGAAPGAAPRRLDLQSQAARPAAEPAPYVGPATTLGRSALSRTDVVVRGKLARAMTVGGSAEVGRLTPEEWLRGAPRDEGAPLTVLSQETGVLPSVGRDCLLLLRAIPTSGNWELVESVPLDDEDGPERLAAFRKFLEIESDPGPSMRIADLRLYLRTAVLSDRSWTRWNAAREYAALAREVPGALAVEDRAPLAQARERATDRALRALLDAALAACPGGAAVLAKGPAPRTAAPSDDGLAELTARFAAPGTPPAARRQAVVDAAVGLGVRGAPLFERALADADPSVREAGAAAAGELRVASLAPRIVAMLADETSPAVRRTSVVAAGRMKAAAAVPALSLLATEDGAHSKDAVFALARIRDDAALRELRRLRGEARTKDRIVLLDFLLSDAFVQQERTLDALR